MKLTVLFLFLMVFQACVDSGTNNKRRSNRDVSSEESPSQTPNPPTFTSELNYLQNGSNTTTTNLTLPFDTQNNINLRGKQVDAFIKNGQKTQVQCLVIPVPTSLDHQVLVLAMRPESFNNFSTLTVEYFYRLELINQSQNQTLCQTAGLITSLNTLFPAQTLAYSLDTLCPSCQNGHLSTLSLQAYSPSGIKIQDLSVSHLTMTFSNDSASVPPGGLGCQNNGECQSKGFDCCSSSQCVMDKELKSGVNISAPEFLQARADILINPQNIFNYPQYYHFCTAAPPIDPTPVPPTDPQQEAQKRFSRLQELHDCTTPHQGEMSFCTTTIENALDVGTVFQTGTDDRTFLSTYTGTNPPFDQTVDRVIFAGETYIENGTTIKAGASLGPSNDNLNDTTSVTLTATPGISPPDLDLKIRYKIDGSCLPVNSILAKCEKYYLQGQNTSQVDDHFPASNQFLLPFYADTNKLIKVEVDDTQKLNGSDWLLVPTSPAYIEFQGVGLQVFDGQKIKITYFVDLLTHPIFESKKDALEEIASLCDCGSSLDCRLTPVYEDPVSETNIIDYRCSFPSADPDPVPALQTVLLSSKNVPVRFFDHLGTPHTDVDANTPEQEGTTFEYDKSNLLKPNNVSQYVGFNEIYGTLNFSSSSAKPAKEISVIKGKTYDLFVDTGTFSSCLLCGSDYYSNLARIFPDNFSFKGGGYRPDGLSSNPFTTNPYRSDDLLFGRACFIPVTMIPWTHAPNSDRQTQRLRRQKAQHFLFANGYNRDWFGFDYGSVIGSFNGIHWFAIGNQRRIKADSSKLFLAVNAYFGDLTVDSTFTVTVSDTSNLPGGSNPIQSDFASDGAQCQQFHLCDTDNDCFTQLGAEYTCQEVTNLQTLWPTFDENGLEVPDSQTSLSLLSLVGSGGAGNKRCVYRARGVPCNTNYASVNASSAFNGVNQPGLHMCAAPEYCQRFIDGTSVTKFNDRISRFGKSVKQQNASSDVAESDLDTFGLGVRQLGRPYSYAGDTAVESETLSNLTYNNVSALCLPGKNTDDDTFVSQHSKTPSNEHMGDQVNHLGMTPINDLANEYLSSCLTFNDEGNIFTSQTTNTGLTLSHADLIKFASTQNLPTNSLSLFESLTGLQLIKNFESEQITEAIHQENRCLRAPGSSCFKDTDCGPSKLITDKTLVLNADDTALHATLNKYEIQFWQEELICSQETPKTDPSFSLVNNRCCRDLGKDITIGTLIDQSEFGAALASDVAPVFDNNNVPGTGVSLNSPGRYSRLSTIHQDMIDEPTDFPPLISMRADSCGEGAGGAACKNVTELTNQFNSFATTAERTCCSGHWVREFHQLNGGGHKWTPLKMQNIDKQNFRCVNWSPRVGLLPFTCSEYSEPDDPGCSARTVPNSVANRIFDWIGTLELLGIPQIAVKSNIFSDVQCNVDPVTQLSPAANTAIPGMIATLTNDDNAEYIDTGQQLYAADDSNNFNSNLKMIFSADNVTCCQPAGTQMSEGDNPDLCCTGFINPQTNRCALDDFNDITLHLNRYISSGAKEIPLSEFDAQTGFLKTFEQAALVACRKKMCASGVVAAGVSLSNLKVPGHETSQKFVRRLIDGNDQANNANGLADLFDRGLKWNNHAYCVPRELLENSDILNILDCDAL